ncbi:MAG TPA: universal stress protein, partial [Glaciihabitans sp.]|nr:universal stress protein [Glaciihabitans sp.]
DETIASAKRDVDELYEKVREVHVVQPIKTSVVVGDPVEELKRMSQPDSLVVVGTHRRKGSAPRYEWSLGARLAAHAAGPVAIVPERSSPRAGSGVVVGTDGSAASLQALNFAAGEADRTGQVLHVLHAWQNHSPAHASGDWVAPSTGRRHPPSQRQTTRRILDEAVAQVSRDHPDVQVRRELVEGPAQWALLDRTLGMSLLVIGGDGQGGPKDTTLGSVAHAIVVNVRCPTVVVKHLQGG